MTKEQFNRDAETRKRLLRRLIDMGSTLNFEINGIIAYNPDFVDSYLFCCIGHISDSIEEAIREIEHKPLIYKDTDSYIVNVNFDLGKFMDPHKTHD